MVGESQLMNRSLPTPEVRGSNPVICLLSTILKDKNKEKEAGNGPLKNVSNEQKCLQLYVEQKIF